ncbi:hypothetical protein AWT69_001482 [Pseudomonas putida]|nr:hypothetical protein AWT69_001482 [Pseudomonas putida]
MGGASETGGPLCGPGDLKDCQTFPNLKPNASASKAWELSYALAGSRRVVGEIPRG